MQLDLRQFGKILLIVIVVIPVASPGAVSSTIGVAMEPLGTTFFTPYPVTLIGDGFVLPSDRAGFSVAIDGATAVVGAPLSDVAGVQDAGAVFVFRQDAPSGDAENWGLVDVLTLQGSSLPAPTDQFGWSVAISGNIVVVGARLREAPGVAGSNHGGAFMFDLDVPGQAPVELVAPDAAPGDFFGYSVAVEGDSIVVGAPGHDGANGVDSGKAYRFDRCAFPSGPTGGICPVQRGNFPLGEGSVAKAEFGKAVAMDAQLVAVGAPGGKPGVVNVAGTVTVFDSTVPDDLSGWTAVATLTGDPADPLSLFGLSVDVSAGSVAIGAPWSKSPTGAAAAGAAHVFLRKSFNAFDETKLFPTTTSGNLRFGYSVAIAGDGCGALVGECTAVIGAQAFLDHAAYVFNRDTDTQWGPDINADGSADETQRLTSPRADVDPFGGFGESVAMSGRSVIVGAPFHDLQDVSFPDGTIGDAVDAGAAFVFTDEALVAPDVEIPETTTVGAGTVIESGAEIGENVHIGDFAYVESGAIIDDNVIVGDGVVVESGAHVWHDTTIEDGVQIGEGASVLWDTSIGEDTIIGAGALVGARTEIGADSVILGHVSADATVGSEAMIGVDALVGIGTFGDGLVLEEGASINNFANVGDNVFLGEDARVGVRATIGDNVSIGTSADVSQGVRIGHFVSIGVGGEVGANTAIGDGADFGDYVTIHAGATIGENVTIGDGSEIRKAIIEDNVTIGANVFVGNDATVYAGSIVPDGAIVPNDCTAMPISC